MAEYEKAQTLAWKALIDAQPQREMLAWVLMNSSMDGRRTEGRIYRFELILWENFELKEGQFWERDKNGHKQLTSFDRETGEKLITITLDLPDDHQIPIFEIEVDVVGEQAEVTMATDLTSLNPDDFYLNSDNFDFVKTWKFDWPTKRNLQNIYPGRLKI